MLGDRPPWQIISAAVLADALDLDHGLIAVWRQRRLGPLSLPASWFRGNANGYRVSDIWRWLAARNGLPQPSDEELIRDWFLSVAGHSFDVLVSEAEPATWWAEFKARTCPPTGVSLTSAGRAESWRWPWR